MKKRVNKYIYEIIVQGKYECGWEDVTAAPSQKQARSFYKDYRKAEPHIPHRIVNRRTKNPDYHA